jgi:hypothetical protein
MGEFEKTRLPTNAGSPESPLAFPARISDAAQIFQANSAAARVLLLFASGGQRMPDPVASHSAGETGVRCINLSAQSIGFYNPASLHFGSPITWTGWLRLVWTGMLSGL